MISVGIDVSKGKSTVCVLKPGGEVLRTPFEIQHTMKDLLSLVNLIESYTEEVRVILEDTGHYHWPVVTLLVEKDIFVCTVNALRMKKYCAQSIRKAKNDRIDAFRIASYGLTSFTHSSASFSSARIPTEIWRQSAPYRTSRRESALSSRSKSKSMISLSCIDISPSFYLFSTFFFQNISYTMKKTSSFL